MPRPVDGLDMQRERDRDSRYAYAERPMRSDDAAPARDEPTPAPRPARPLTDDQFARMSRSILAEALVLATRHATPPPIGRERSALEQATVHVLAVFQEPSVPLPRLDLIGPSFGRHDVSQVRAYGGPAVHALVERFDARALAVGERVLFAGTPDVHTAAHEAAHVIQQRSGIMPGPEHEAHADAVADLVVRGRSAEALLSRFAGSARSAAVQLKSATAPAGEATWNPHESFELLPGHAFQSVPGAYGFVVDTAWYASGAQASGNGRIVNVAKNREILAQLRSEGVIGWATDAGLATVAAAMGFPPTQKRELTVYFATDIFGKIGLPPTASAMCSLVPGGIGLALRVDTKRLTGVFEATGSTVDDFYRGLDTFTGLPSDPALRNHKIELTVGDGAAYKLVPNAHLASLYGARAWDAWLTAHHGGRAHTAAGGATGASIVSSALAAEETTWLLAWSQRNVPRAANGAERTALTRDLLVAARAIESSPYRAEILAALRAGVGADAALDAAHLEAVTHQIGFDAERREAGADRADAERAAVTTTVDPIIDAKLPAALKVNAGLVVDGDVVAFVIDID